VIAIISSSAFAERKEEVPILATEGRLVNTCREETTAVIYVAYWIAAKTVYTQILPDVELPPVHVHPVAGHMQSE